MHAAPRVGIGLPVYNGADYLSAALDSILAQTFTDFEVVICDNASIDATAEIARSYAAADSRVRFEPSPSNVGPHLNHLRAIELTSGEYFKWFAHDDLIAPTFLERCVEALDNHPKAVLAASRIQVIDDAGTLLGETDPPPRIREPQPHLRLRSFWRQPPVHQTMYGVIRRSALEQTHLMGDWFAAERALFLELTLQGGFERVDEPLASHREHHGRSDYKENKSQWWAPERGAVPEMGYWKRLGHGVDMLRTAPLSRRERMACLMEYFRYGFARAGHWIPTLIRELGQAASTLIRSAGRRAGAA
jgi:glycosyltransferase involved in cell wall biosynthesis